MDTNTAIVRFIRRKPLFYTFIDEYIAHTLSHGPSASARHLAKLFHCTIRVHVSSYTNRILAKSGCLIAFNHPYEIETYIVQTALPDRFDTKMIATANILFVAPKLKPYIIPVYVDYRADTEKRHKLSGRIATLFSLRSKMNAQTSQHRNRKSIASAAGHINSGGIVLLSPEGFRGKGGRWFSGVGHLISQIKNRNNSYYVACFIRGTSNWDWFRVIPLLNRLFPPVHIYFSEPVKISELYNLKLTPKQVAQKLESSFRTWSSQYI